MEMFSVVQILLCNIGTTAIELLNYAYYMDSVTLNLALKDPSDGYHRVHLATSLIITSIHNKMVVKSVVHLASLIHRVYVGVMYKDRYNLSIIFVPHLW